MSGESLGVPIRVFGPDSHITEIVPLALGIKPTKTSPTSILPTASASPKPVSATPVAAPVPTPSEVGTILPSGERTQPNVVVMRFNNAPTKDGHAATRPAYRPFDAETRSFIYGLQPRAIQGMLDFDYS